MSSNLAINNRSMNGIITVTDGTAILENGTFTTSGSVFAPNLSTLSGNNVWTGLNVFTEIDGNYLAINNNSCFSGSLAIGGSLAVAENIVTSGVIISSKITLNALDLQTILSAIIVKIGGI